MHRVLSSIVLVCLITLTAYGSSAGEHDRFKDKYQDRIETLTMWRLMQALDLDNATSQKILQVRGKFLSQRKELRKTLHQGYRNLRTYLNEPQSKENDKKLAQTIEKIRETRKELRDVWEQQFDAMAKVLPVRKQAELVIFMRDFRREIKSILHGPGGRPPRPQYQRGSDRSPTPPGQHMGRPAGPPEHPERSNRRNAPDNSNESPGD